MVLGWDGSGWAWMGLDGPGLTLATWIIVSHLDYRVEAAVADSVMQVAGGYPSGWHLSKALWVTRDSRQPLG